MPSNNPELRPSVPAVDAILGKEFPVLDHGFVRVIDYMGSDEAIVQAARVSYGRGTKTRREDVALIRYLMRHSHTSPFEMCEIKLHVKLPIFVARQWIRHRTANVNEYSARYSILDREFYVPDRGHLAAQSAANKQGRSELLTEADAARVLATIRDDAHRAYDHYLEMLNENENGEPLDEKRVGLARELARMNLSVNFYTQWYWKIDLHNLLHFLRLRVDPHAQLEIRMYAQVLLELIRLWVPATCDAFEEYKLYGMEISATAVKVIKRMLAGESVTLENSGLNKREWDELILQLGRSS